MTICLKLADRIVEIEIGSDCYFGDELAQMRATIEGESEKRLAYISDLKETVTT